MCEPLHDFAPNQLNHFRFNVFQTLIDTWRLRARSLQLRLLRLLLLFLGERWNEFTLHRSTAAQGLPIV